MGVQLVHCTSMILVTTRTTGRLKGAKRTGTSLRVMQTQTHNGGPGVLPGVRSVSRAILHSTVQRRQQMRLKVRFSHFCSLMH